MYELLDIPHFSTSQIIKPFKKLVLDKEILHTLDEVISIEDYTIYIVADGAINQEIDINLEVYDVEYRALYPEAYCKIAGYAQPFLINMESSVEFVEWFLENGYGNSQAIFIFSQLEIDNLLENLQAFTVGLIEEEKETLFRFYDPKIFPAFLRIITQNQVEKIFKGRTYYLTENLVTTEAMDVFFYSNEMHKTSFNLLEDSETVIKKYPTSKELSQYNEYREELLFDKQDITLLSHSKEYVYVKQATFSILNQVEHLRHKKIDFKDIYLDIFELATEGIDKFGLTDKEVNYLWIVARVLGIDFDELFIKDTKLAKNFQKESDVSQSYKGLLLEELIYQREEILKKGKSI